MDAPVPATNRDGRGLSESEAIARLAARPAEGTPSASRSYGSIVRANVLTVFNLILAFFGAVTLLFGDWRDALFLTILVANSGIGIVQEIRAKRALDRLAALIAPTATVVRDGRARRVGVEALVPGDLVRLDAGDQVVADGRLVSADGLRLDESALTGESTPVTRVPGDTIRSLAFVVEGAGTCVVTAVGSDSWAERLVGQARAFRHPRSPLERALNRLLGVLVAVLVPLGTILGYALWRRQAPLAEAVPTAVASVVTLVPEGLILLSSLTYAVAALRMARHGALAQQLNAIESLAAAQVVCLDKTGTLTEPGPRVVAVVPAPGVAERDLRAALGRFAAASAGRNATLAAIAEACPSPAETAAARVPFSSRQRWSAVRLDGITYVLGAPDLFPAGPLRDRAEREAREGRRVVTLGASPVAIDGVADDPPLPADLSPLGLVVLSEQLRPGTRDTIHYLRSQGVTLKVLSGDAPETAAAIATDAGIPFAGPPVDGHVLPEDREALTRLVEATSVVGRVSPEGKQRIVDALRAAGHYVAMIGDGVNDVPALKAARLAIAQGSGAQMAKSVADVVLVRSDFSAIPVMIGEGRKLLRNLQRVTKLFVAKSAFAAFLVLSIGVTPTAYPLLPRHLTLAASLTIGIPAFFIALAPSSGRWQIGPFLKEVARFAVPAGTAAGLGVLASYQFALEVLDLPLLQARTVAETTLVVVGLYLVLTLEATGPRRGTAVGVLCALLLALYALVLAVPGARDFFALAHPRPAVVAVALAGAAVAIIGLVLTDDRFVPGSRRDEAHVVG